MAKFAKSATADTFNLAETLWESMVAGTAPWQKTWQGGAAPGRPMNVTSGKEYRSGNSLHLMLIGMRNGWSSNWISYKEMEKLGGNLKGQRGSKIEVPLIKTEVDQVTGKEHESLKGFRTAVVFNVDQIQGIDDVFEKTSVNVIDTVPMIDRILGNLLLDGLQYIEPSKTGGCFYLPSEDLIGMPLRSSFNDTYEFYSSLAHEISHATMKTGRVERESVSYAYEELRAEIAATMICCTLNLPRTQVQVNNHAAYLKPWLDEFEDKKHMLLKAATDGQMIHDYLIKLTA